MSAKKGKTSSQGSLGSISSKGVTAPPDVVYKMAKKIAQLTKVVYYLNTKHEDHDDEMELATESYENHISEVSTQCAHIS